MLAGTCKGELQGEAECIAACEVLQWRGLRLAFGFRFRT